MTTQHDFCLIKDVLYKKAAPLSTSANKLVLPRYIATQIVHYLHHDRQFHVSAKQKVHTYILTYHTPNISQICKQIEDSCAAWTKSHSTYKKKTTWNVRIFITRKSFFTGCIIFKQKFVGQLVRLYICSFTYRLHHYTANKRGRTKFCFLLMKRMIERKEEIFMQMMNEHIECTQLLVVTTVTWT